jgi:hypothetical protein
MIEDREIWACAHQVMGQYGEGAAFHAAQRADELLAANDIEGCRVWLRILTRIEDLETIIPDGLLQ